MANEQGVSGKPSLVIIRHTPYGSSLGRAALDAALALAAFDVPLHLLFMGDGVLHLLPEQDSRAIGVKNIGKLLASMPLYDIDSVYVDADAVERYGLDLDHAPLPCHQLDAAGMRQMMVDGNHLLGF